MSELNYECSDRYSDIIMFKLFDPFAMTLVSNKADIYMKPVVRYDSYWNLSLNISAVPL